MAAVLVGYNTFLKYLPESTLLKPQYLLNIELTEIVLGVFIGAITFTGSIIAFGKLRGIIGSKALSLPGKQQVNLLGSYSFYCTHGLIHLCGGAGTPHCVSSLS